MNCELLEELLNRSIHRVNVRTKKDYINRREASSRAIDRGHSSPKAIVIVIAAVLREDQEFSLQNVRIFCRASSAERTEWCNES